MTAEFPDVAGAFPRLGDDQLELLARGGKRRPTARGEVLIAEGRRDRDFLVVLDGLVGVYEQYTTAGRRLLGAHGPGRFLDEIGLINRQPAFVSTVVLEDGAVLAVPVEVMHRVAGRNPALGDLIVRALIRRRELLVGNVAGVHVVGSRFTPDTARLREFLARNRVPCTWTDVEDDADAEAMLCRLGVGPGRTPLLICGQETLHNPSNAECAAAIGLAPVADPPGHVYDLIVVGAGPAGLAAGVYGACEGLDTVVLDTVAAGGQAATSPLIENYLGFPAGISGAELADRAMVQADKFGAALHVPRPAVGLAAGPAAGATHVVHVEGGDALPGRAVLIATGARYRRLDVPGLAEFEGHGVYYAATFMETRMCRREPVVVVGGGNSAGQAALSLAERGASVRLVVRHDDLGRDMSRYLVEQLEQHPAVDVFRHARVCALDGADGRLGTVVVERVGSAARERLPATRVFAFIGADPCTGWLGGAVELDEQGFVRTDAGLRTSCAGVFAAGDVRSGAIRRVAAAVGDGALAVRQVHRYLTGEDSPPVDGHRSPGPANAGR
ncbi:FAD-dependent oxidoreductase [Dactylosporangium sp. NPDC005572]|uniref:FAD-dependent oxidoreductase n=1 Tax=Dactylosporangium sp. NPDC005572 TaxID=3156889 RepID=UPI0033BD408B